ncbi:hypothetical protein [Nocardia sp. NPDC003963]
MNSPDPDPYVPPVYRQPLPPAYMALAVGVILAGVVYLVSLNQRWWVPDTSESDSATGNGGHLSFLGLFVMAAMGIALATLLSRRMYLAYTAYPGFIGTIPPLDASADGSGETTGWVYLTWCSGWAIVLFALLGIVVRRRTRPSRDVAHSPSSP